MEITHENKLDKYENKKVKYVDLADRARCRKCLGCQQLELPDFDGVVTCPSFKTYKGVQITEI